MGVGSGSCTCGIDGPFAGPVNDASQFPVDGGFCESSIGQNDPFVSPYQDGTCCYLVGITSCEGRPLFVEGGVRKAAVRRGAGW